MKSIPTILMVLAGILAGVAFAPAKTVTVEVPVERIVVKEVVKEVPGPERIVTVEAPAKPLPKPAASLPISLPVSGAACSTGNCRVPQAAYQGVESYQPRRRLFGRFR